MDRLAPFYAMEYLACAAGNRPAVAKIFQCQRCVVVIGRVAGNRFPFVASGTRPAAVRMAERIELLFQGMAANAFVTDVFRAAGAGADHGVTYNPVGPCRKRLGIDRKRLRGGGADGLKRNQIFGRRQGGQLNRNFLPGFFSIVELFFELRFCLD